MVRKEKESYQRQMGKDQRFELPFNIRGETVDIAPLVKRIYNMGHRDFFDHPQILGEVHREAIEHQLRSKLGDFFSRYDIVYTDIQMQMPDGIQDRGTRVTKYKIL